MPVLLGNQGSGAAESHGPGHAAIVVGLVNNMPDGAIRATQQQFLGLLNAASGGRTVRLKLFQMASVPRAEAARSELLAGYAPLEALWDTPLDALIVTGSEPKAATLSEEPYWPELTRLIDWAEDNTQSAVWSCLAAHAAVLHLDGVGRHAFPTKLSGVFETTKTMEHALVAGVPLAWPVPHSRQFGLTQADLVAKGYQPLSVAKEAGVDIFVRQRKSLFLFFQGHLEYDAQSLFKEYLRDIQRYLSGERDHYPDIPTGYFDGETAADFEALRQRATGSRSSDALVTLPKRAFEAKLNNAWRPAAVHVYQNWLTYLAGQKLRVCGDSAAASTTNTINPTVGV